MRNYRGKTESGEWVKGSLIKTKPYSDGRVETYIMKPFLLMPGLTMPARNFIEVIPESVGRFTGHLNWHQGDVIRSHHFGYGKDKHYLYHVVTWNSNRYCFTAVSLRNYTEGNCTILSDGNVFLYVFIKSAVDAEIIGNITDNPELLK